MVNSQNKEGILAVDGNSVCFDFGGRKPTSVLNGVNISVEKGVIYALLGPSGCGKTTLLRCIVGCIKPKEGQIKVFGKCPGEPDLLIPGRAVGYMPQELALHQEMTVEETLTYFGCLYQMDRLYLAKRISFLVKFLDIPHKRRLIKKLSGGQQRRVSFAVAIIHKPSILILDEPTVGVDPLLRKSVWDHLSSLAAEDHITIIITTHYIEEASQANIVGLMRNGRLLAESNPKALIKKHHLPSLEVVFLKLCQNNSEESEVNEVEKASSFTVIGEEAAARVISEEAAARVISEAAAAARVMSEEAAARVISEEAAATVISEEAAATVISEEAAARVISEVNNPVYEEISDPIWLIRKIAKRTGSQLKNGKDTDEDVGENVTKKSSCQLKVKETLNRLTTLIKKDFIRLKRNIPFLIFQLLIPSIEIIFFFLSIGGDPYDLPVAVTNMENSSSGFSNWFLQTINNCTMNQKVYSNISLGLQSVRNGESWGALYIGPHFTRYSKKRFGKGGDLDNKTLAESSIKLYLDMSNPVIGYTIHGTIWNAFQAFIGSLLMEMHKNPLSASFPVTFETPVYGKRDTTMTEYIAPGMLSGVIFAMSMALTAIVILLEKKQGLLDRIWIVGVSFTEVILSMLFTFTLIMIVQVALVMAFTFLVFDLPIQGPFLWTVLCILLCGFCGMAYGVLISVVFDEEFSASMFALGSISILLSFSGLIWPLEAVPKYLRYISYGLPFTLITDSLRFILYRGWTISDNYVWQGILVTLAWSLLLLGLCVVMYKIKR